MRWTCPKCGKKLEISNEQLISNDGIVVCPQCLLQARQPIPKARVSTQDSKQKTTPVKQQQQSISFDAETPPEYKRTTPPPPKARMKQASTSYRYTGVTSNSGTNTQRPATKKKNTGKKKSNKKQKQKTISGWGCMGRTIIFTLILFAAYVFFGLLLEALQ